MNLKKPLNIAFIVRKYTTSGGTERYVYTVSKKLSEIGHNITIYCSKVKILPPNEKIRLKKIFTFPGRLIKTLMFYHLSKKIDLNFYDIVQGCGKVAKQDIFRAGGGFHKLYLKYQKKRDRLTIYDKFIIKIEKDIYNQQNTKFIIAVSNFIKREIINEFNFPEEKIFVLYNGVDCDIFTLKNNGQIENSKNLKILFVANDYKLKGLEYLLKALQNLKNVELKVVGNDIFYNENLIQGVNVNFLGEKHGKDLIKLYQDSDILVHPTFFDPFSNVCLEALSCGLPVITTKINGVSEILDNYKDGIVIDSPENIKNLIEAIKFFQNKGNLLDAKKMARKKAKLFSIDNHVKRLLEIYKEVIKTKK